MGASKLFHAIVAIGVSLGTACAGKVGADLSADEKTDPPKQDDAHAGHDASVADTQAQETSTADVVADAIKDVAADVPWDAWCDAAWPTTKGSPPLPTCIDPKTECKQDEVFPCAVALDAKTCDQDHTTQTASVCVNGKWTCKPGRRAVQECTCWRGPSGDTCKDGG
jgi:hypothetical protein